MSSPRPIEFGMLRPKGSTSGVPAPVWIILGVLTLIVVVTLGIFVYLFQSSDAERAEMNDPTHYSFVAHVGKVYVFESACADDSRVKYYLKILSATPGAESAYAYLVSSELSVLSKEKVQVQAMKLSEIKDHFANGCIGQVFLFKFWLGDIVTLRVNTAFKLSVLE